MKTITVSAAVIRDGRQIFVTQRGYGEFKDKWEFPGGKLEPGESSREALVREIREELNTEIAVGEKIDLIEYDYPDFHLTMHVYWATILQGNLTLLEHESGRWCSAGEIEDLDWLPADRRLLPKIREKISIS